MPTKTDQTYKIDGRATSLDLTAEDIAYMTRSGREARVELLLCETRRIFERAVDELIVASDKDYVGSALLFSGGNDSTTLGHIMRGVTDVAIHANTGIGVEATRSFVREVCSNWDLPFYEEHPTTSYRDLVLAQGFPGPGQHFKMFQQLKERALMKARAKFITRPRSERLVFLAGRRKDESARRSNIPLWEREGSAVWVSPLALWTKLDLNTYRLLYDVPRNTVSDLIHMSGECLCGSFAKRDELAELGVFYPEVAQEIAALEAEVHAFCKQCHGGHIQHDRCSWGWGAYRTGKPRAWKVGALCSSCPAPDGGSVIAS